MIACQIALVQTAHVYRNLQIVAVALLNNRHSAELGGNLVAVNCSHRIPVSIVYLTCLGVGDNYLEVSHILSCCHCIGVGSTGSAVDLGPVQVVAVAVCLIVAVIPLICEITCSIVALIGLVQLNLKGELLTNCTILIACDAACCACNDSVSSVEACNICRNYCCCGRNHNCHCAQNCCALACHFLHLKDLRFHK